MYNLLFVPEARDDLARMDKATAQRILDKLRWLADRFDEITPQPLGGEWKGLFKPRVGPCGRSTPRIAAEDGSRST